MLSNLVHLLEMFSTMRTKIWMIFSAISTIFTEFRTTMLAEVIFNFYQFATFWTAI